MEQEYQDNPLSVEAWLGTLTDTERAVFDKGFVVALLGVIEQCVETKTKLLNKSMDEENAQQYKLQLLSRVHILDVLEKHYRRRIAVLEPSFNS